MRYDLETIRERISMVELYTEAGYQPRRAGLGYSGLCPFHEERTGSFSMRQQGLAWRGKCFGCGWSGDVMDFYAGLRGAAFKDAVAALAGRCGLGPLAESDRDWKPVRRAPAVSEEWTKPWMPPFEMPTGAELEQLGTLRGLAPSGLRRAVEAGHLRVCDWPWRWDGEQRRRVRGADAVRSWVITDGSGWVAQYRTLDGSLYQIGSDEEGWRTSKSWSTKNVSWPVGAPEIGDRTRVLLMEGGADLLACYHFLHGLGLVESVAVCCILGAANRMAPQAMGYFRDREVRILADADVAKDGRSTGMEAAGRWQDQLAGAGAIVTVGWLDGLTKVDGSRVKDVNDLVHCDAETLGEAIPLFEEWGF